MAHVRCDQATQRASLGSARPRSMHWRPRVELYVVQSPQPPRTYHPQGWGPTGPGWPEGSPNGPPSSAQSRSIQQLPSLHHVQGFASFKPRRPIDRSGKGKTHKDKTMWLDQNKNAAGWYRSGQAGRMRTKLGGRPFRARFEGGRRCPRHFNLDMGPAVAGPQAPAPPSAEGLGFRFT